jgi:dehydrogenase/reductase SDR family member 4
VERAAAEGATVVVSSRKASNVDRVVAELRAQGLRAEGIPCHMGKTEDIQRLVAETVRRLGRIDGLVSNAAVSPAMGPMTTLTEAEWDKIMGINLRAAWLVAREAVPHMPAGGAIVFVASTASFAPSFPLGAYGVSKTALLGLTKALAHELGPSNIRVNCLAPGLIKTRFSEELWKNDEIASRAVTNSYLGRIGAASEMGGMLNIHTYQD